MPAPPPFVRQVRHALVHLYDPDALRAHPLLTLFGLSEHANPPSALRTMLLEAIEALRPAPNVPLESRAWRAYKMLQCRYAQQMDQAQTALQLGVTVRHVRREQKAAVEALADLLHGRLAPPDATTAPATRDEVAARLEGELAWLKGGAQGEPSAVAEVLQAVLQVVAPLAAARSTRLETQPLPDLPSAALHPSALRQALVSAATCAIRRAPAGKVRFSAAAEGSRVLVEVMAVAHRLMAAASQEEAASLAAVRALLSLEGGRLDMAEAATALTLTLVVPAVGAVDVLLVDDNADFAQLFGRYVAGTRYRLLRAATADGLIDLVATLSPQVIVLDVMMPGIDGWEILGRLRQHPQTGETPIIVCTILPERELALALGATGFLPKPFTRQELLLALSQALGEGRTGSR